MNKRRRLASQNEREFLGVMCIDYEYYRSPIKDIGNHSTGKGPPIYDNTYVLQLQNEKNSLENMLEKAIIRAPVYDFAEQGIIEDHLFGDTMIQSATFEIPAATNSLIYEEQIASTGGNAT